MFCANCENKIEQNVSEIDGVLSVRASYRREEVELRLRDDSLLEKCCSVIESLDYKVAPFSGDSIEEVSEEDRSHLINVASVLIIMLAIYLILNHLGFLSIFNIFPAIENTMSYGAIFVVGLLTSVHCIAMCGGINLSQSIGLANSNRIGILRRNVLYNVGRIISYTIIGALVGALGSILQMNNIVKGVITGLAGVAMIIMALNMLGIFKWLRVVNITIPKSLSRGVGKVVRGRSSFLIGLVNGLMPCGPLQSMQIYALASGGILKGALSMFCFGTGTSILMLAFGLFAGRLSSKSGRVIMSAAAIVIFMMGIHTIGNGAALSGLSLGVPALVRGVESEGQVAVEQGDMQIVRSEVDYGSYEPIYIRAGIPVRWTIVVPEGRLNGCNGEIIVPEYDIDIKLVEGENEVTFTPVAEGGITYSCWMGMIKSTIYISE